MFHTSPSNSVPINSYVLKVASRCNLNCSYCYVYNQGDNSWKSRPARMSDATFEKTVEQIRAYSLYEKRKRLNITFHGGEPCLIGSDTFNRWCRFIKEQLSFLDLAISIQTNGTLLDAHWGRVLKENSVSVGVSIDGPADINDRARVDHAGKGSHEAVIRGINFLKEASIDYTLLCVIPFNTDPLKIHHHLLSLSPKRINYLFPDSNQYVYAKDIRDDNSTPCADFLIPIFEEWWNYGSMDTRISIFIQIAKLILGGASSLDTFGGGPLSFVFIETDGDIEILDVLKTCENGLANTHLNVFKHEFNILTTLSGFHKDVLTGLIPLPDDCRQCPEKYTCSGGYLPHRYRKEQGFNNSSIWCADILKLFELMRNRLEVNSEETILRRTAIEQLRKEFQNA